MKRRELLKSAQERLAACGVENAQAEAKWLYLSILSLEESEWLLRREENASNEEEAALEKRILRRISGEPIQYILGKWPFLSLELFVGPGVLIPRPETELLCEAAAEHLPRGASVLDLCAGSGAVGLGICSLGQEIHADCVELFEAAFSYLARNLEKYPYDARAIRYDVLIPPDRRFGAYDRIVSNPPYVAAKDLAALAREVSFEPETALSGGEDGLLFYRAILKNWLPLLKAGGELYVEIGEDQGVVLSEMMKEAGLTKIRILKDFSGLDRIAAARKDD